MPSVAIEKYAELLEGLKYERICLSCWMEIVKEYLDPRLSLNNLASWDCV